MAELLDEAAPIGVSAALQFDSQLALDEAVERIVRYQRPSSPYNYAQIERAMRDTGRALRRDPMLRSQYGPVFDAALRDLTAADAIRKRDEPLRRRRPHFDELLSSSLARSLGELRAALHAEPTYRSRAQSRVIETLERRILLDRSGWNRFDGDISRLCAGLLAEARHGPSIVQELAESLVESHDADSLAGAWRATLAGTPRTFEVVIFVDGMSSRRHANRDGFRDLGRGPFTWHGGDSSATAALSKLAGEILPRRGMALRTAVTARDAGQASVIALENAEALVTRVLHEHRVGDVDLLLQTIVLDRRRNSVRVVPELRDPLEKARISNHRRRSSPRCTTSA